MDVCQFVLDHWNALKDFTCEYRIGSESENVHNQVEINEGTKVRAVFRIEIQGRSWNFFAIIGLEKS